MPATSGWLAHPLAKASLEGNFPDSQPSAVSFMDSPEGWPILLRRALWRVTFFAANHPQPALHMDKSTFVLISSMQEAAIFVELLWFQSPLQLGEAAIACGLSALCSNWLLMTLQCTGHGWTPNICAVSR